MRDRLRIAVLEGSVLELLALNAELVAALEWLDHRGGLGSDVHERIRSVLAKARFSPTAPLTSTRAKWGKTMVRLTIALAALAMLATILPAKAGAICTTQCYSWGCTTTCL